MLQALNVSGSEHYIVPSRNGKGQSSILATCTDAIRQSKTTDHAMQIGNLWHSSDTSLDSASRAGEQDFQCATAAS